MAKNKKRNHMHMNLPHDLFILGTTYVIALGIFNFGHMKPYVVALMPCLAFTLGLLIRR